MLRTMRSVVAVLASLAMLASACAGGEGDGDGGATDAAGSGAAAPSGGDDGSATDEDPVVVAVVGPLTGPFEPAYGMVPAMLDAAADGLNDSGGVQGRPLEFVYCDTEGDPAREGACAREVVADGAVANLGIVQLTPDYVDVLGAEGVPIVGPFGRHPVEFSADNSWPLTSGNVGLLAGGTRMLLEGGAEQVQVVVSSSPGGALARAHMTAGFDAIGAVPGGVTLMPEDATDASSTVAAATSASDAVATMLTTPATTQYLASRAAMGDGVPTSASVVNLPTILLQELGEAAEGIYLASPVAPLHDTSNAGVQRLREAAEAAGLDADGWAYPEYVALVWANFEVFVLAAQAAEELTADGLQSALGQLQADVDIIAPVDLTEPVATYPGLERVFNNRMLLGRSEGGRFEPFDTQWVDPTAEDLGVEVPALG